MANIFQKTNKRLSVSSAAFMLAGFSVVGTVLGLVRVSLINSNYFNKFSTDAFFAAFKIPDFIFFALASGALTVAFIPVLSDRLTKSGKLSAWRLTSSILNTLALGSFILSVVILIFAPQIIDFLFHFDEEQAALCASIMRIIAVNPFLFSISTVLTATQQATGRFFFFALAPLVYNASIIAGILLFRDSLGIIAPAIGVAIGAVLQLIVSALGMLGMNFRYTWGIDVRRNGYGQVMRALPPRAVDQGVDYINNIFEIRYATALVSKGQYGAVTNYENAIILHNAPVLLIGMTISSAAFPRFTERLAQGRPDLFRKEFLMVLRAMLWIALPVVIITYFTHDYLARLIAKRENQEIATILQFLVPAILFRTLYTVISRWYYAQKDTKTPLFISLFVIALNIIIAYNLSQPDAYGVVGLAIAQSIIAIIEVTILSLIMIKRDRKLIDKNFVMALARIFATTGFTLLAALIMTRIYPLDLGDRGLTLIAKLSIITSVTLSVHVFVSWVLRVDEVKPVIAKAKQFILRPVKIQ
jgi:putative peptidoglycan lipid II flippase